jgi:membrane protease YdiL (CAAX protease family)
MDKAQDEAVWFSALISAFAFYASHTYPSLPSNLLLVLALGWLYWSIYKMTLDRL